MSTQRLIVSLLVIFVLAPFAADLIAQPPGLPDAPSQAPIDGGLGLLVAAGGAYAWKKLKSRNS